MKGSNLLFAKSAKISFSIKEKEKDINGINIPKGAVANGRAKFESQRISPEKPLRFFASRSRPATPILPVKTPKVPVSSEVLGWNVT